jgi:predicted esterase
MKKKIFLTYFLLAFSLLCTTFSMAAPLDGGHYKLVVEGFDWGPGVSKVILAADDSVKSAILEDFSVFVKRSSDIGEIPANQTSGEREVLKAYISDKDGMPISEGKHITLILAVAPYKPLGSPIQYFGRNGNKWIDYQLTIIQKSKGQIWNNESGRVLPIIDEFNLEGKFTHKDINMSYASYKPENSMGKTPLIIWLHGGGEGGTDPTIALIGNRAANYASQEIQSIFDGAYVLVPQAATFWMHSVNGGYTRGDADDIYNEALMALIEDYVAKNPGIDKNRIYVGGCSNGGYMSLKLILNHPGYFAAGYISALAYQSDFITDKQIQNIKNVPIWFVQSKDDKTTDPTNTVIPVYNRLKTAGASNVHFTFYEHVNDITGQYGGDSFHYNGHWSWIYVHANKSMLDFDGKPVKVNNMPVTIMQWLAAQKK